MMTEDNTEKTSKSYDTIKLAEAIQEVGSQRRIPKGVGPLSFELMI